MAARLGNRSPVCLGVLFDGLADLAAQDREMSVPSVHMDSREVQPGGLFLACAGSCAHGLDFLHQALQRGAAAVACEPDGNWTRERIQQLAQDNDCNLLLVPKLGAQVSRIAGRFYGDPGRALTLVGVTGTNGKTSCTQFLAQAMSADAPCGVVGTLGNGFPQALETSTHTTPDPIRLQSILADLKQKGAVAVAMEVSSHALDQGRVQGIPFDFAVLTNLSRDHLDYHGTMSAYAEAKRRLFQMPGLGFAVLNLNDPLSRDILAELPSGLVVTGYGQDVPQEVLQGLRHWVCAKTLASDDAGMILNIDSSWGAGQLTTSLLGGFNVSNLLAVLSVLLLLDIPLRSALERLAELKTVPGRMERFGGGDQPLVVVDYAHTPDALAHVLRALQAHKQGDLICVFGCGGDRDRGKRPEMAAIAESLADRIIVTDDNPRTEDGDRIIDDIIAGLSHPERAQVVRDRAQAIRSGIENSTSGDLVLVAGKGHENTQQVGHEKLPFDDREQVTQILQGVGR